jgi:hypothetical protein
MRGWQMKKQNVETKIKRQRRLGGGDVDWIRQERRVPESQSYTVGWTSTVADGLEEEEEGGVGEGEDEEEKNTAILECDGNH